jgi:nucleoside phosphorylase
MSQFDVGLIVPLQEEFDYIVEVCPAAKSHLRDTDYYIELTGPQGERIISVVLDRMSAVNASVATERLLRDFDVSVLAMVGLGGALDRDLRLGDVVIPSHVEAYLEESKAVSAESGSGFEFKLAGSPFNTPTSITNLVNAMKRMPETAAVVREWREGAAAVNPGEEFLPKILSNTQRSSIWRAQPNWYVAPMASGPTVGAAQSCSILLLSHNRKFSIIEMEAAGVTYTAGARSAPKGALIVRGVSDFSDERKSLLDESSISGTPIWRRYAVLNAVTLMCLISRCILGPSVGPLAQEQIERALASRYRGRSAILRLLSAAQITPDPMALRNPNPLIVWRSILAKISSAQVRTILDVAVRDYGDSELVILRDQLTG